MNALRGRVVQFCAKGGLFLMLTCVILYESHPKRVEAAPVPKDPKKCKACDCREWEAYQLKKLVDQQETWVGYRVAIKMGDDFVTRPAALFTTTFNSQQQRCQGGTPGYDPDSDMTYYQVPVTDPESICAAAQNFQTSPQELSFYKKPAIEVSVAEDYKTICVPKSDDPIPTPE